MIMFPSPLLQQAVGTLWRGGNVAWHRKAAPRAHYWSILHREDEEVKSREEDHIQQDYERCSCLGSQTDFFVN